MTPRPARSVRQALAARIYAQADLLPSRVRSPANAIFRQEDAVEIARAILTSDWYAERIAQARREGAADELDRRADSIDPGDHHCFKPWCPHCAVRKGMERERDQLRERAAALRGDA